MVRTIYQQLSPAEVHGQLDRVVEQLREPFAQVAELLADAAPDILAFTAFPVSHWQKLWSNNPPVPASTIFAGWRQSVLPVHLLGLDALLGCVGPVAGDVKLQDDGVVHDPVNRRGGGHGVGKDAFPLREDQV